MTDRVLYQCSRNGQPAPCRRQPTGDDDIAKVPCGMAHVHNVEALDEPGRNLRCPVHKQFLVVVE